MRHQIFTFSLLFGLFISANGSSNTPLVHTASGILQGFSPYPNVNAYLGIPYALPPVGNLRFAPPRPIVPNSSTILDATQNSAGCYQVMYLSPFADKSSGPAESEDCLSINIWAPAQKTSPLPVLIWLYGGGFGSGANSLQIYNGVRFVAEQNDVMLVAINYRVNIFGFPNSPAIKVKNPGLLDQRLAIEWIRDNIRAFGGDPTRMTLLGHSAGAISIALYSYQYVDDPIVSAFAEISGQPPLIPSDTGVSWKMVVNSTGCAENGNADEQLACLKTVPPRDLKRNISVSNLLSYSSGNVNGGVPVTDNVTLLPLSEYYARGAAGQFAKLPLLATNTLNEADITVPFDPVTGINYTESDFITQEAFHCPVAATTGFWASHNLPVYRYLYSGTFPEISAYPWIRAYHGADIQLLFASEDDFAYQELGTAVQQAGVYLRSAVAAFVRDPVEGLANYGWPKYTGQGNTLVNLFANNTPIATFDSVEAYDQSCQIASG